MGLASICPPASPALPPQDMTHLDHMTNYWRRWREQARALYARAAASGFQDQGVVQLIGEQVSEMAQVSPVLVFLLVFAPVPLSPPGPCSPPCSGGCLRNRRPGCRPAGATCLEPCKACKAACGTRQPVPLHPRRSAAPAQLTLRLPSPYQQVFWHLAHLKPRILNTFLLAILPPAGVDISSEWTRCAEESLRHMTEQEARSLFACFFSCLSLEEEHSELRPAGRGLAPPPACLSAHVFRTI